MGKEVEGKNEGKRFKERYLCGQCGMEALETEIRKCHGESEEEGATADYLGLTKEEYAIFNRDGIKALEGILDAQRRSCSFHIYQLDLESGKTIPFAFKGIRELYKAGYKQPPATCYRTVCDSSIICPTCWTDSEMLNRIRERYGHSLLEGYRGRPLASSDVVELKDGAGRCYFYVDGKEFEPVKFSPFLAKPMEVTGAKEESNSSF